MKALLRGKLTWLVSGYFYLDLRSADADLAAAYLTAKATASPRKTADHEELELLLENYSQRFEGIITGVSGALVSPSLPPCPFFVTRPWTSGIGYPELNACDWLSLSPQARIKSNQDVVELSLASTRNKLLQLDLKMSLCTVGLTLGAFGASLLGMNVSRVIFPRSLSIWYLSNDINVINLIV